MAFEELGPTFVKLGQVFAMRTDLILEDFADEFKKLHDQVSPLAFEEVEKVLKRQFGENIWELFTSIEEKPMAAASIAQVHGAVLKDGSRVVLKVRRPGISHIISEDVEVMYMLAEMVEKYLPEFRVFNPRGIVEEFFRTLELETNFIIEANNIRRFRLNFVDDPTIVIPKVYLDLSSPEVLVLERMDGITLSHSTSLAQDGIDPARIMRVGIQAYFKMVFKHGFFHGDLHAGNLFILPGNRLGLIDFGMVGRLNRRTQDSVANMFVALYKEDYERLAYEYVEIAPYNEGVNVDLFAKDLQYLLSPYFGLSMKNVNLGHLLMKSTAVAAQNYLVLPADLMIFFKSIVTVEGMGRMVAKDFDFLQMALEFSNDLVKTQYDPKRLKEDAWMVAKDAGALFKNFPREIRQLVRRVKHPEFAVKMSLIESEDVRRTLESTGNLIFLGLIIAGLIISGSLALHFQTEVNLFNLPMVSALMFIMAGSLGLVAFYNYIRR